MLISVEVSRHLGLPLADTTGAATLPLSKTVQAMPDLRMGLPYLQILEKNKIKHKTSSSKPTL